MLFLSSRVRKRGAAVVQLLVETLEDRALLSAGQGGAGLLASLANSHRLDAAQLGGNGPLQPPGAGSGAAHSAGGGGSTAAQGGQAGGGSVSSGRGYPTPPGLASAAPADGTAQATQPSLAVALKPTTVVGVVPVMLTDGASVASLRGSALVATDAPTNPGYSLPASRTLSVTPNPVPPATSTPPLRHEALSLTDRTDNLESLGSGIGVGNPSLALKPAAVVSDGPLQEGRVETLATSFQIDSPEVALPLPRGREEKPGIGKEAIVSRTAHEEAAGSFVSFLADSKATVQTMADTLRSGGWSHALAVLFVASGVLLGGRTRKRTAEQAAPEEVEELRSASS
jgi:hypothetical protein